MTEIHESIDEQGEHLPFGQLLKFWRKIHELSQEELAFRIESSPRHISRLENSRVHPSKTIITRIAQVLNLGQRDSGQLYMAGGYTPVIKKIHFHDDSLKWLRKTMLLKLRALDPYPAVLTNVPGDILMVNRGWVGFHEHIYPASIIRNFSNYFELMFQRPVQDIGYRISEPVRAMILMSLTQAALMADDHEIKAVIAKLLQSDYAPDNWQKIAAQLEPTTSFRIQAVVDGQEHSFFEIMDTSSAVGPAAFVPEPQLTLHTLYPEDDQLDLSALLTADLSHPSLFY